MTFVNLEADGSVHVPLCIFLVSGHSFHQTHRWEPSQNIRTTALGGFESRVWGSQMLAPVQSTAAGGRERGQEPVEKWDGSSIRVSGEETEAGA